MKAKRKTITLLILSLGIASALFVFVWNISGQTQSSTPVYNPYPPGILPANLDSEIARVQREVDVIEARAVARWQTLAPPVLTGQPPVLKNTGTEAIETPAN